MSKMNEFLEILRVQAPRLALKINVNKNKSEKLEISEDEKVTLGNKNIDQVGSFTTLLVLLVKTVGAAKMYIVE